MDKLLLEIKCLKQKLAAADEDLHLAGNYGNQLLNEKQHLQKCSEVLKQEKHSLQLNLDAKVQIVANQSSEIEFQKTLCESLGKDLEHFKQEYLQLSKKSQKEAEDNIESKSHLEELLKNNEISKAQISSLRKEVERLKNSFHVSLNETNSEEFSKVVNELQQCQSENKKLLVLSNELQCELEQIKYQQNRMLEQNETLQQGLREKDDEIKSYSIIVEKGKEENYELMAEIETLKLQQVDVNRRGNSLFGEVDDRRKVVEKEYIVLKNRYKCLKENYDYRIGELQRVKIQLTTALGMMTQNIDRAYIEELENKLHNSRKEILNLNDGIRRQSELLKSKLNASFMYQQIDTFDDGYNFLRLMLEQSKKKSEALEKEVNCQRLAKIVECDKLISTRNKLYFTELEVEKWRGEFLKLQIKLDGINHANPEVPNQLEICEEIPEFEDGMFSPVKKNEIEEEVLSENDCTRNVQEKENKENQSTTMNDNQSEVNVKIDVPQKHVLFSVADNSSRRTSQTGVALRKRAPKKATVPSINLATGSDTCTQQ